MSFFLNKLSLGQQKSLVLGFVFGRMAMTDSTVKRLSSMGLMSSSGVLSSIGVDLAQHIIAHGLSNNRSND
jgi:hypothetical protein